MEREKSICSYCNKPIEGYVETSRLDQKIKLCSNCYYIEMFERVMSKIITESEKK